MMLTLASGNLFPHPSCVQEQPTLAFPCTAPALGLTLHQASEVACTAPFCDQTEHVLKTVLWIPVRHALA